MRHTPAIPGQPDSPLLSVGRAVLGQHTGCLRSPNLATAEPSLDLSAQLGMFRLAGLHVVNNGIRSRSSPRARYLSSFCAILAGVVTCVPCGCEQ